MFKSSRHPQQPRAQPAPAVEDREAVGSSATSDLHPTASAARLTALRAATRHGLSPAAPGALPGAGSALATHEPGDNSKRERIGAVELGGERLLFTRHRSIVGEFWSIASSAAAEAAVKQQQQ